MAKKTSLDPESATTQVNIADFQRTRDSVIVALATLQSSVQDLSRAYINHANTVLAPGRGGALDSNLTNILSESGLLSGGRAEPTAAAAAAAAAATAAAPIEVEADGKKKRKRTPHDPFAPKRALTPYFLYMQSARSTIAKELGEQAKPKEVADEGTRRWTEMTPAEKSVWDDKYQKNLAAYRVKMAAYKAGQPAPTEDEVARLVAAGKAPDHVAGVELDAEEDAAAVDDTEPEPVKQPASKSKRRKTTDTVASKDTPKAAKSPDKKSKKAKKEVSPVPTPAPTKASEKKKKAKKAT